MNGLWRKEFRVELAVFCMDYHSGQWSRGYAILSKLSPFNFSSNFYAEMRETEAYEGFVAKYAKRI